MPNNDLISRASVLEELKKCLALETQYNEREMQGIRIAMDIVSGLTNSQDSLSSELESLPKIIEENGYNHYLTLQSEEKGFEAFYYSPFLEDYSELGVFGGKTPLAAVLALKEALNSTG